jgi:hypothetical protein
VKVHLHPGEIRRPASVFYRYVVSRILSAFSGKEAFEKKKRDTESPSEQFVSTSMPIGSPCRPFLFWQHSVPFADQSNRGRGGFAPLLPPLTRTLGPAELSSILGSVKTDLLSWTSTSLFMQGDGEYGTRIARLCMAWTDARDTSRMGEAGIQFHSVRHVYGLESV